MNYNGPINSFPAMLKKFVTSLPQTFEKQMLCISRLLNSSKKECFQSRIVACGIAGKVLVIGKLNH